MPDRPTKITFGEMREMGLRGDLVWCADYRSSHCIAVSSVARRHAAVGHRGPLHLLGLRQALRRCPAGPQLE